MHVCWSVNRERCDTTVPHDMKKRTLFSCYINIDSADFKRLRCCTNNKQFGVNSALNQSRLLLYAHWFHFLIFFSLPGVVSSTVDCSSFDETGRLSVEGRPADGPAETSRVPRPAGHLNQEAVRNHLSAGGAHPAAAARTGRWGRHRRTTA